MYVRSELGVGSTFIFDVQALMVKGKDVAGSDVPARRVVGLVPGQPAYRILLVEDSNVNRKLLLKLLEPLGFVVREAVNGRIAVDLAQRWQPHLILMDLQMPEMDGLEATRRIKKALLDVPIIALTAAAFSQDKEAAFVAGCDDFMLKPVHMDTLFHKISQHLDVQFIYDTAVKPDAAPAFQLTPERLAGLSKKMRRQLNETAVIADRRSLKNLIAQIQETDPPLAKAIAHLVKNFQFEQLVALTEAS